jgi:hypothetical protein
MSTYRLIVMASLDIPLAQAGAGDVLAARIARLDRATLKKRFQDQNEFLVVEDFLPPERLSACLRALPGLAPMVNRNYIPGHKKGGSVSRFDLDAHAPAFGELYRDAALVAWFRELAEQGLQFCPPADPHAYALYYYTEPGDHIGFHYDTSYYAGARYTALIGLVDESSCRLECKLFRGHSERAAETLSVALRPGMLVFFNGDKVYHRITPAGAGERRIALTLEYVTDTHMHPWRRFVSNMKDAIAYFGFRQVFGKR